MKAALLILGVIGSLIGLAGGIMTMLGGIGVAVVGTLAKDASTGFGGAYVFWAGALAIIISAFALIFSVIGGVAKNRATILTFSAATAISGLLSIYLYNWTSGSLIGVAGLLGLIGAKEGEAVSAPVVKSLQFMIVMTIMTVLAVASMLLRQGKSNLEDSDRMVVKSNYTTVLPPEAKSKKTIEEMQHEDILKHLHENDITLPDLDQAVIALYKKSYDNKGIYIDKLTDAVDQSERGGWRHGISFPWNVFSFETAGNKYRSFFFEARGYGEDGQHIDSHVSDVSIDIVTFVFDQGQWKILSKQYAAYRAGSWGMAPNANNSKIHHYLPSLPLIVSEHGYGNNGEMFYWVELFGFEESKWRKLGFILTYGNNGGAHGEDDKRHYSYEGTLQFVPRINSKYPDIIVDYSGSVYDYKKKQRIPMRTCTYKYTGYSYDKPCPDLFDK